MPIVSQKELNYRERTQQQEQAIASNLGNHAYAGGNGVRWCRICGFGCWDFIHWEHDPNNSSRMRRILKSA